MNNQENKLQTMLRNLPSVSALLNTETANRIAKETGTTHLTKLARTAIESLRKEILPQESASRSDLLSKAESLLAGLCSQEKQSELQRVINASGVIIHTNLGRAPLSEQARKAIFEEASRYCALEYDLETGKRGRRGARVEELLKELTGAEDALVVNNCAAAAFLVLTVMAQGGESIVSRGELVEIGGDFRIPDVMVQSGARLVEVGTTNRTKLLDYERAITENTRLIMCVHPSNYRIVGFTAAPDLEELAQLAHAKNLLLYEDAGSGALVDLKPHGLDGEPVISESIANGADVVTFSGDKLLGGVQAGLIVGQHQYIERLRKHPLYRALRVDKLAYAALSATLESYLRGNVFEEIPVLQMLSQTQEVLKERVEKFISKFDKSALSFNLETIEGESAIGGGSAPTTHPKTFLITFSHEKFTANEIEKSLREADTPIITRIFEDRVLIDLRTVFEDEEEELIQALKKVLVQN